MQKMIKIMNNFSVFFILFRKELIFLFIFSLFATSSLQAAKDVKINSTNQIIAVWQEVDPVFNRLQIKGSYTLLQPGGVILTDPSIIHAFSPIVAIPTSPAAIIKAIMVCKAYVMLTGNIELHYAIATASGWTAFSSTNVLLNDDDVFDDYDITLSADALNILITYTGYDGTQVRSRIIQSTNGGSSWTQRL